MSTDTATFTYYQTSRVMTEPTLTSEGTITLELVVTRKNGALIMVSQDSKLLRDELIIPLNGEHYPTTVGEVWESGCRFRGSTVRTMEGGRALAITLNYSGRALVDPTSYNTTWVYALPVNTEYAVRMRSTTLYRTGYTTSPPPTLDATTGDIGGTSLTGADQGYTAQVQQASIRLRAVTDASVTSQLVAASNLATYVNTRNSAIFMGCAIGSVICEGVSFHELGDEYYEIAFEFLYDAFYHHEQVAQFDVDGKITRNATGSFARVDWKRMPRAAVDFNAIFLNPQIKLRFEKGWWI